MGDTDFDIDFYGDADGDANEQPRQEERRHSGSHSRDDYDYHSRDHRHRDNDHDDDRRYDSSRSDDAEDSSHHHGVKRKSEEQENERPIDNGATAAIMISELSWWTTDDDIRGWLRKASCEKEVKELTFSEHKVNGKSKGQAYVEFETRQAATAAKRYIDSVSADSVQPGQKKITTSYWNPGVNPFRTLPKDAPARVKEQPRAAPSGSYNDRGNYGGFRGRGGMSRGGMNPNFNRGYSGGMGYNNNNNNNNNMGGGGFNGPMGGVAGTGGTHYVFSGRSSPGGTMRGVQTIIRGRGGGGGGGGGMMNMNPMGGMPMGMPMGMIGNGMPDPTPSNVLSALVMAHQEHQQEPREQAEELQEVKPDKEDKTQEEDVDNDQGEYAKLKEEPQAELQAQNPQAMQESSGQVANASAVASSAAQPRQYYQYYPAQTARGTWGCHIHGTLGPRCMVCDVEYWRHYHYFVGGYRYHGRVPPPPFPIFPMPLHRPSFQGMPPNFPGGFGFGQQGGGSGSGGGGGNNGDWGNPHGAKRPRPE
ncbi:rrm domain-containing [Trichoderma arundinaceum]|uniref:Rrm domain-containing n=1 Tax=Trichoderma arundinaceum TaxID=490622 RepID=A0A395N9S7_TRIAR|nr:rrm domain-containing [Trichoderma arundinaceum]